MLFFLFLIVYQFWYSFVIGTTLYSNNGIRINPIIVCEGERANISCPMDHAISILLANYGRFTLTQCNPTHDTDISVTCKNDKTLGILQLRCNDRRNCEFTASNELFGDNCPSTSKYLDMEYACNKIQTTTTTSTKSTTTVTTRRTTARVSPETSTVALLNLENGKDHLISLRKAIPSSVKDSEANLQPHCVAIENHFIGWPRTQASSIAKMPCPNGAEGFAEWQCGENGQWNANGVDLSKCVNTWSRRLRAKASEADDNMERLEMLQKIQQLTRKETLMSGDLIDLSSAILHLIPPHVHLQDSDLFTELVVESANNMVKEVHNAAWFGLAVDKRNKVADTLFDCLGGMASALAPHVRLETTRTVIKPAIEMEISNVKIYDHVMFPSMSLYKTAYDSVVIPKDALNFGNETLAHSKVVYVQYSTLGKYMQPKTRLNVNGNIIRRRIASKIVSASIFNELNHINSIENLAEPIVITFNTMYQKDLSSPTCVWWDSLRLLWSGDGCEVHRHNSSHTICHCSHLTHFAVLMDIHDQQVSYEHNFALTVLTYMGCILSIFCLIISLFAFICFGNSDDERVFVHKNLCLSLLVAELVFLFGIWRTDDKLFCGCIAGLLHFFFLAAFSWMLLEGIELYYMLVEVFQSKNSRKKYLFVFGYGLPTLIVSISAWVDPESYGTARYCWLRSDNYFILAFICPVALILTCNCIFLLMTLCIVCSHSNIGYAPCKQNNNVIGCIKIWLRGAVALISLLGFTWTFGLLWVDQQSIVMAYVFTIFNSSQGLFIFLFHVILNDKIKSGFSKWTQNHSWTINCANDESSSRSTSTPYPPIRKIKESGSSIISEYPTLSMEKYSQRMMGINERRYNPAPSLRRNIPIGTYDYATIAYSDQCLAAPNSKRIVFSDKYYPTNYLHPEFSYRPPPNFPPPPPPPAPGLMDKIHRSRQSTVNMVSNEPTFGQDLPALNDGVEAKNSGMLFRMDLSRNPPIFVQGIVHDQ